jgi:hypothetical protein
LDNKQLHCFFPCSHPPTFSSSIMLQPLSVAEIDARIDELESELLCLKQRRNTFAAPFLSLPAELIVEMCNNASLFSTTFALASVCQELRKIVVGTAKLWTCVDVCQIRNPCMYRRLVRRAKGAKLQLTSGVGRSIPGWLESRIQDSPEDIGSIDIDLAQGLAARKLWELCLRTINSMTSLQSITLRLVDQEDEEDPHRYAALINRLPPPLRSLKLIGLEFWINSLEEADWPSVVDLDVETCGFGNPGTPLLMDLLRHVPKLESLHLECNVFRRDYRWFAKRIHERENDPVPMTHLRSMRISDDVPWRICEFLRTGIAPSQHLMVEVMQK